MLSNYYNKEINSIPFYWRTFALLKIRRCMSELFLLKYIPMLNRIHETVCYNYSSFPAFYGMERKYYFSYRFFCLSIIALVRKIRVGALPLYFSHFTHFSSDIFSRHSEKFLKSRIANITQNFQDVLYPSLFETRK